MKANEWYKLHMHGGKVYYVHITEIIADGIVGDFTYHRQDGALRLLQIEGRFAWTEIRIIEPMTKTEIKLAKEARS